MTLSEQIAKHFREVYFGGNWTCSNVKEQLADVTWREATQPVEGFNSIAALTFHMNYYVAAALKVLNGGALEAHDRYSYDMETLASQEEWEKLLDKSFNEAERFTQRIERLPEEELWHNFDQEKYGSYYRNLHGITEHCHYHLGQIVILKKLIRSSAAFAE